jgi:hypothetical protein
MQANAGEAPRSLGKVIGDIMKQEGPGGLFKGIIPRIGLGIWQTLFMVSGECVCVDDSTIFELPTLHGPGGRVRWCREQFIA